MWKKCLTQRDLINTKHHSESSSATNPLKKSPEEKLHPLYFKVYIEKSVKKIADDGFYTAYQQELHGYVVGPLDKVNAAYKASD